MCGTRPPVCYMHDNGVFSVFKKHPHLGHYINCTSVNKLCDQTLYLPHQLITFCKQFGPRSGPTKCRAWSGSKLFDMLTVFLKEFFEKVDFKKNQQTAKNHAKFPSMQWVKWRQKGAGSMSHMAAPAYVTWSGPCREKTCLRYFRQSEFQTSLLSYRN